MTAGEVGDFTRLLQDAPAHAIVLIILVFMVLVWVKQGFSRLVEPVYFWRNRRRELLDAYLATHGNDATAPEMLAVMADTRDAMYFYEATGIYDDKKWRGRLVKLHEQTSPSVSWRTIKLAKDHLLPEGTDGVAVRSLNWMDLVVMLFIAGAAGLFLLVVLDFWLALQSIKIVSYQDYLLIVIAALMLVAGFLMIASSVFPYMAARKIRKELASPTP